MKRFMVSATAITMSVAPPAVSQEEVRKPGWQESMPVSQKVTGTAVRTAPAKITGETAGELRKGFARCIVSAKPKQVAAFLSRTDAASVDLTPAAAQSLHEDLSLNYCLGNRAGVDQSILQMRFSPGQLRDFLSEEVYLARNLAAPVQVASTPLAARYISNEALLPRAKAMTTFADCTIAADLRGSDALLRTMPGSVEERAAATALAPALGSCLEQGQDFVLKPSSIRAMLAYGLWLRFAAAESAK